MRLARIRILRFPFCLGRPSDAPNYLDGRYKRDPEPDGGGGNPYARAPTPTTSATSVQSSPSSSTRSSAPSAPSVSSSNRYHTSNSTDMSVDKLPNLDAYLNEITKFNITSSHSILLSNGPKGHQAPLHETTSKRKLASNNADNTNAEDTDDTAKMLSRCQIGS